MGIEYHDFSRAKNAITENDKSKFGATDQKAWDVLTSAEALIAWSNVGLNAATKARLPIAVVKENVFDVDYGVAQNLAEELKKDGFNIVNNASDAALFVVVSHVEARSGQTGNQFAGSRDAQWDGTASLRIRAVWIGEKAIFSEQFSGHAPAGSEEVAKDAALSDALVQVNDTLFRLSNQR
jgi:hypothetical protein